MAGGVLLTRWTRRLQQLGELLKSSAIVSMLNKGFVFFIERNASRLHRENLAARDGQLGGIVGGFGVREHALLHHAFYFTFGALVLPAPMPRHERGDGRDANTDYCDGRLQVE